MKLNRLLGVAKKAFDAKSSSGAAPAEGGQTDWRSMVRSAADAITGDGRTASAPTAPVRAPQAAARPSGGAPVSPEDRAAIARYDYLLETADPAQIELVHREAFERLTPVQRAHIEQRMRAELPAHEQPRTAGAGDLARTAARAEASRPGLLRGLLARVSGGGAAGGTSAGGGGRGAMIGGAVAGAGIGVAAGGMLAAVAGGAILSSVAGPLLAQAADIGVDFDALAGSLDVDGLTAGAGETVSGLGDQVSGLGDQVGDLGSGFSLPGLDDIFGR